MKNNNEYLLLNFKTIYKYNEIWKNNNEYLLLNFKTI